MKKIILYIATSKDGFIADKDGDISWLPQPKTKDDLEAVGYNKLMDRIDAILMGSRSYEQILSFGEWGWPNKSTFVFTSRQLTSDLPYIHFSNKSPKDFIQDLQIHKDIWLLGGAKLAQTFHAQGLIHEIILTIIPKEIKDGIALDIPMQEYKLRSEKECMNGIEQRFYLKKN